MRKLYLLLILALGPLLTVLAQPTLLVGDGTACTGESFCVPVTSQDFTNINSLELDFGYDPAVLSFTGAQNFQPLMQAGNGGNLGPGLFDNTTPGIIRFGVWETGDCSDPGNIGVTLADDVDVLFDLCFDAIGTYGEQSTVGVNASPTPRSTRNATLCNNIGVLRVDGEVTLCVRELNITAADVSGNEGDQVCVDFTVNGFDALNGIQFTVNYDPDFLEFANLFPNTEIPANTLGAYGLPEDINVGPGNITVVWSYTITDPPNVSVADGTTMFTVCFDILGSCETSSPITFSGTPTPIEANNDDPANPTESSTVPLSLNPGVVSVNDCNPEGIEINIDCGAPVNLGDIVCVEFAAGSNFDAVRRMEYLMSWNPNILEFQTVDDPNNLSGLSFPGNFDVSNIANGILGLDWEFTAGPPQSMTDMELIYRVCFEVIGVGGDSPIQIITPGIGVSNGVNIGINPTNCVVQVNQPEGVVVDFGDISAPLGGSDCVPVTVSNFNDVLSMEFTMNWDEQIWLHNGTIQNENPAIAGANPTFTPVGVSSMGFQIDNGAIPISLADGSVLFEICFETAPTANPGDCDQLTTVGLPFPESAITSTSNGDNIGLIVDPGEMCVLFPEGFGLTAVSTSGGWLDTICMDFTVESFDNITAADFNINWNPTVLQYVSSSTLSWNDVVLTPVPAGTLNGSFSSPTPVAIPDGEVAFQVCFQLIGDPNECYPVTIQDNPMPTVETSNGQGSLVGTDGEICVEDQIVVTDVTVVPPSCPGACDGSITITVAEWAGQGFIGTTWTTENPTFQQFTPLMLDDVCEGMTIYRIFDNDSGVFLVDTLFIVSDGEVPTAVINGDDPRQLDCNSGQVLLTTDTQDGFNTLWYQNSVGGSPDGSVPMFFAPSPGDYILCVENQISGCVGYDTVTVIAPELPIAEIIDPTEGITCFVDSIMLDGSNSIGENLTYTWYFGQPDEVEFASGPSPTVNVGEPGRYRLEVTNNVTGCTNSVDDPNDVVFVADDRIRPTACVLEVNGGAAVQEQNCDGTPITFSASCTNSPGQFLSYFWYEYDEVADTIIQPDVSLSLEFSASDIGVYAMVARNEETGCLDTSYAEIIANSSAPQVQIDDPQAIDCNDPSVILNATIIPNDPTFTFVWTTISGMEDLQASETLTPTAIAPGTYQIVVTNPANGCTAEAAVAVADETELPEVEITTDMVEISCFNIDSVLRATVGDGDLVLQWYRDSISLATEIPGADADTLVVTNGGVYIIQVSNPGTGCVASDTTTVGELFTTPMLTFDQLTPQLDCNNPTFTVNATVTNSTDFTLGDWTTVDGNIASVSPDGLSVTIDAGGVYVLTVVDNVSGCDTDQDFVASEDFVEPTVNVANDMVVINCANEETGAMLDGTGSSVGQDFSYRWENQDGMGPDMPTALNTTTSFPGTYLFTVTNENNGCFADTMVVVTVDTIAPMASIAAVDPITCLDQSSDLTVDVTGADNFIVEWAPPVTPDNQVTVTVTEPGTYPVRVVNTDNGCDVTTEVTVDGDITAPPVTFATPATFDCGDESVVIDATASGIEDDFDMIQWTLGGTPLSGENMLTLTALEPGEYGLMLTSSANGCDSLGLITVEIADPLTLPELPVLNLDFLGCDGTPVTIDASATGDPMDFSSIEWTGGTFTQVSDFVIDVTEAATYTLSVVLDSPVMGCEASAEYLVEPDPDTPVAMVGSTEEVAQCGIPAILSSAGSTPLAANITYEWTGTPALVPNDVASPEAPETGSYELVVTNTDNGCTATSETVTVTFEFPDDAFAGADAASCDSIFDLSGNLPTNGANITGVWTTTSAATIDMPNSALTMISGLTPGANAFTWTLSADGCPEFSSDDVVISSGVAPVANPDFLDIEPDVLTGEVSLIANDLIGGSNYEITILQGPAFGTYDTMALDLGTFSLSLLPTEFGITEVTYQICSAECPDLCSTSTLTITVQPSDNPFVPNTVTPNGDGANDELIFDVITFSDPEEIPDNEIIIFNRWGDIIYQAKPYNNDWTGLNQDGQPIPEATYYYVLRLNISRGEIIRGDITVIR